MDGRIKTTG